MLRMSKIYTINNNFHNYDEKSLDRLNHFLKILQKIFLYGPYCTHFRHFEKMSFKWN